jgi:hypothetical protein
MFACTQPSSRCVTLALALVLAGKSLHCAWESQAALAQITAAAASREAGLPLPVKVPSSDCNESGCLCRGATLAAAVDIAHLQPHRGWLLPGPPEAGCTLTGNRSLCLRHILPIAVFDGPPLSGRQLRALLASLVI